MRLPAWVARLLGVRQPGRLPSRRDPLGRIQDGQAYIRQRYGPENLKDQYSRGWRIR